MKLSIVTISFNQAQFLERTITSVLAQQGVETEYIIVDPGSTDGSREILERYRKQVFHVILDSDEGPADGLNKGFALATGDWFGYINSDDFYLDGGLALAAQAIMRWPLAGAVVGNGIIVDADDQPIARSISQRFSLLSYRLGAGFSLQQATFYRTAAFRAVDGFNINNRTCWDGEILVDIASAGYAVKRFNADVGAFRVHSNSITGSGRLGDQYRLDQSRIRQKIGLSNSAGLFDPPLRRVYRIGSVLADPWRTARLIIDKVGGFRGNRGARL